MRRIRRTRPSLLLAIPLLLAACRDAGDTRTLTPGPDDLRLAIVTGKGIVSTVRPVGVQEGDSAVVLQDITVRVTVSPDLLDAEGVTGPGPRVRLPAVEVRWRALEAWCQPVQSATPLPADADSVANRVRRPTVNGSCHLVAEGVAEGRVFDTDTAVIDFRAGPAVVVQTYTRMAWPFRQRLHPAFAFIDVLDAYGNHETEPVFTTAISRGAPVMSVTQDGFIRATAEATGEMEITVGTVKNRVELWALEEMRRPWRITWACYGGAGADGAQIDSVHYRFESATTRYGAVAAPGIAVTFEGNRFSTTWVQGRAPVEHTLPNTTFHALQRPGLLEWSPGQVALGTGNLTFQGGTLCEAPPGGGAWARTAPVRAVSM
ncbi:MAG TPA: hypothetical protein VHG93_19655 [Longimicrobium sp.]|nr:hypothetical protein [Longimicrobium sp.]